MQTRRIPALALTACAVLLLPAAQAGDWTPSAAPPSPAGAPGSTAPMAPPSTMPMQPPPAMAPGLGRGPGPGAFAAGDAAAPEYDADTGRLTFDFAGVRLTQSRTDDAYLLDIELRGLPADQVDIRPAGGGLMLVVRRTAESTREETVADGRGYQRSWSFSSGQNVRRLPAPPDADLRGMQRTDGADAIQVSIPRRSDVPGYGMRGYGPPDLPGQPGPGPGQQEQP
jgi:hypothetical protein